MRSAKPMFALVAAIAFAVAWFAPRTASATILPACELREQVTVAPQAEPARIVPNYPREAFATNDAAEACASPLADEQPAAAPPCDELTDVPGLAPMSDARGATTIAPPRIRGFDGGRIEVLLQCSQTDLAVRVADEARSSTPFAFGAGPGIVAVVHDATPTLGPAPLPVVELSYPPPGGGPLHGVRRGIEHPPR